MAWFVYMLRCNDKSLYTGVTTDVERRAEEHNHDKLGAKYTRMRRPVEVVYFESCEDRSSACQREYQIKQMTRRQKLLMIKNNSVGSDPP